MKQGRDTHRHPCRRSFFIFCTFSHCQPISRPLVLSSDVFSEFSMLSKFLHTFFFFAILSTAGCISSIGDSCESDRECPSGAVCDVTAPGGYCMIQGCDTNQCPTDSICIDFDKETSFCMEACENESDCRDAYACKQDSHGLKYCYTK